MKLTNFKLYGFWILVDISKQEEVKTKGGLILPFSAPENQSTFEGKIVAISEAAEKAGIAVGDKALFEKHAVSHGIFFSDYNYPLSILNVHNIIGVEKPSNTTT
jgi:co-chaperonin GroES (HSP10)